MTVFAFIFYLFAVTTVTGGLMTVIARNPVHSVLWLILAFLLLMFLLGKFAWGPITSALDEREGQLTRLEEEFTARDAKFRQAEEELAAATARRDGACARLEEIASRREAAAGVWRLGWASSTGMHTTVQTNTNLRSNLPVRSNIESVTTCSFGKESNSVGGAAWRINGYFS